jgi:hypothetical protein
LSPGRTMSLSHGNAKTKIQRPAYATEVIQALTIRRR